jgi:aryl-alcohol dehydrogenase-like predicted oxidoreductase
MEYTPGVVRPQDQPDRPGHHELRRGRERPRGVDGAGALAWALKNPVVDAPIVGVTEQHHLSDAVAALDLQLTDDQIAALEEPYVLRQATWFWP